MLTSQKELLDLTANSIIIIVIIIIIIIIIITINRNMQKAVISSSLNIARTFKVLSD
mgnify:CR=1 FL=1